MLNALCHCHSKGIIHLDIKPANFVVASYSKDEIQVRLIDFGLAHAMEEGETSVHIVKECGTKLYKAPEVKDNSMVTAKADIYSFAVFIY
jgi:serine/threonine protein kinase